MKFLFLIVKCTTVLLCLSVALGFAGVIHPAFDSLALFRPVLAALCLLILVFPMGRWLRLCLAVSAFIGLMSTVPAFFGGQDGGQFRIYSKNLWYRNPQLSAVVQDIRDSGADVVTLQEVSRRNDPVLLDLAQIYPHQHLCRFSGWSGVAVLSRHPLQETKCSDRRGLAAARIDLKGQSVWVASVHLKWPYPYGNARAARSATRLLAELDGNVVMAGDFNIFPWAASVERMKNAASAQLVQPVRPTFSLQGLPLMLDHVYAPLGGRASYRPLFGSDHWGVLADVRLAQR